MPDDATSADSAFANDFYAGTTSIEAADSAGWVVSVTPSGGWVPAVIAGRTGIGLSERAQSFVTYAKDGPYNVIQPGQRPRVTLTPTIALKDGAPYLAFAVQGGDSQDQNLLQFFLDVVEFGMTPQEASEAPNINSYQMRSSFGLHENEPGRMMIATSLPDSTRAQLVRMGYRLEPTQRTSGPINAIMFDFGAPHDVGRVQQPRGGLRNRVVGAVAYPNVDARDVWRVAESPFWMSFDHSPGSRRGFVIV